MNKLPQTLAQLVEVWTQDVTRFDGNNTEKVAYDMTGRLAGSDAWDELYDGNKRVAKVFDIVADLELPPVHRSILPSQEAEAIKTVKSLVAQLEKEVNDESKKT